jgi:hypothetical protein
MRQQRVELGQSQFWGRPRLLRAKSNWLHIFLWLHFDWGYTHRKLRDWLFGLWLNHYVRVWWVVQFVWLHYCQLLLLSNSNRLYHCDRFLYLWLYAHCILCNWLLGHCVFYYLSIEWLLDDVFGMHYRELRNSRRRHWLRTRQRLDYLRCLLFYVMRDWLYRHCGCPYLPIQWLLDSPVWLHNR